MKTRGLLIAAVVLAALSGALFWSNQHPPSDETAGKAADAAPKILSLKEGDVARLSIARKGEPPIELSRNDAGEWQITAPRALPAERETVNGVVSSLASLNSDRLIDEKVADLSLFGLAAPALEITATLKDSKAHKLLIGDQTPTGSAYYVMLAGDPRVFTLASYSKSSLDKSLGDLRDKRLLTVDFDNVSQIELSNQKTGLKQPVTFAREKEAWQISRPKPYRAEQSAVEELVRSLKDAKFDATATDDAKNAAAFRAAAPFAQVKITGASGVQQLELRKAKDDYYARSTALEGFFKAPTTLGTSLEKSLEDFRTRKLFDFGYDDPNKIEIRDGEKAYFCTRSGSDWWGPDGKKLDDATVQPLISRLRELSAETFAESGFTASALQISVLSNDNKRNEKLQISKNGERYLARRENEPALYEVAASAVADLQKLASEVKAAPSPAPAPAKKP